MTAAWLSFGMVTLVVFLTVQRSTGSSADAGYAVACFGAVSGVLAPLRGRTLDRAGARPWLTVFAVGYGAAVVVEAVLTEVQHHAWPAILSAAVAGGCAPPLIATVRSQWSTVVGADLLRPAYALTSLLGDAGVIAGPVVAALLFSVSPMAAAAVCAGLAPLAASLITGLSSRHPNDPAEPRPNGRRGLFVRRLGPLVPTSVALGVALGLVEVTVPTSALRWHEGRWAGLLLASFGAGSILGGLWFGTRRWESAARNRYLISVAVVALLLVPPAAAGSSGQLAPLLVLAGLGFGPASISLFEWLDDVAADRPTEALTWITTLEGIGAAFGSAIAGWIGAAIGVWSPYVAGSVVLLAVTAVALLRPTSAASHEARPAAELRG